MKDVLVEAWAQIKREDDEANAFRNLLFKIKEPKGIQRIQRRQINPYPKLIVESWEEWTTRNY